MNKILKNRRILFISLFLMAVLSISLGYAYVRSRLNINGSTTISQNSWIFYFDNVVEKDNNVTTENPALIEPVEKRRIDFEVPLEKIQDTYEFNVDIVNAGSLKGQVDQIIKSALTVEQLKKLEFDIRYEDGTPIKVCDVIEPNSRKTITVRVRLKEGEKYQTKEAEDIPLSFEVTYVQYDEDRTCDDTNTYSLTIDPGVGTYGDKTGEVTIVEGLSNGTHVSLGENPTLTDYYFTYWEAINNDDYTTEYEESINTVTIKDRNAYVLAHYESAIGPYTITIDPKGGAYNGSTELFVKENLRNGYVYKLEAEPELYGKLFKRWNPIVNNQYNTKYNKRNGTITIVDKSAYLEAEYGDAIAKIVETNKLYSTIENAFDAAEPGQTILLLDDTEENPLTEKKLNRASNEPVILDLDGHKVTGELINNDIITIVNGTIENINGTALINNGTLTLGVNDDEIDKDNIKIIGKNTTGGIGLQNKGFFNFYDGYLDAFVGLDGIFHDVPFEHYVFVDDDNSRDCQKVYVTPRPSNVIARSVNSNGGVMFYYNLQKAFNTSAAAYDSGRTLWIEAIDYIPGSYDLILDEGKTAFFDLKGYTVSMASVIRNYGNLTIKDSGNETTHTKGKLETSYSMENYGKLILRDLNVAATTNVTLMKNYGSLDIKDSTLTALNGYVMEIKDGKEMIIDNNTYFRANSYALYVETVNPFTIKGGNIEGIYNKGNLIVDDGTYITNSVNKNYGIYNEKRVVINGGTIEIQNENGDGYGVYNKGVSNYDWAYCTMNGGLIIVNAKTAHGMGGYDYYDEITMNGGTIDVSSSSYGRGIYAYDVNMTDGVINVYGRSGSIAGVYYRENANISGGKINTETLNVNSGDNYGVLANYGYNSSIGGNLEITSNKDCMYIPGGQENYTITMNGGNYSCGRYGIYTSSKVVIENVNVDAVSHAIYGASSSYYHYYADITINSGNIKSSEGYGIYFANYNTSYSLKVGNVDSDDIPYIEGATTGIYVGDKYGVVEINKGNIVGKTQYGVYTQKIANIGKDDGLVSVDSPIIKGELYGVYTENEGVTNFYDGILKGKTDGYYGLISGLPDAYAITDGTEEIDESTYETDYLISYVNFVKVGETEYNSLNKAIAAIEESGTMELIASAPIKADVTIPVGKSITLDLAGYSLSLSKQINNNGELTIIDSSEANSGGITCDVADCLYNTGTLNINDGTYQGKTTIIYNLDGVLNFNGGVLQVSDNTASDNIYGIYGRSNDSNKKSEININGGTISVENLSTANNGRYVYAIYQNNQSGPENVTNITGGSIRASGQKCYTYGVYSMGGYGYSSGDVTLSDGTITVDSEIRSIGISTKNMSEFSGGEITVISSGNDVNGIYVDAKANISGGTINVTSTSTSTTGITGIEGVYEAGSQVGGSLVINSSHVCIDGIGSGLYSTDEVLIDGGEYNCGTYGILSRRNIKMIGGTITSKLDGIKGSYSDYNHEYPNFEIIKGRIVSSEGNGIYYPQSSDYYKRYLVIGDAENDDDIYIEGATTGVYIDDGIAFIYNGTIVGNTANGIYNKGTVTIGTLDGNLDITKPVVIGENYGLYSDNGTNNFYDGILKGKMYGYYGTINSIEPSTYINEEIEEISEIDWIKNYLKIQSDIVINVNKNITYNNIQNAVDEADENDVIKLIDNVQLFYDIDVPTSSNITLDLDGFHIRTTKTIINNGTLNIVNNNTSEESYISTGVDISILHNYGNLNIENLSINNISTSSLGVILTFDGGITTLDDVDISSVNNVIIYNGGTININNSSLTASAKSVHNEGIINAINSTIFGSEYGVYTYTIHDGEIKNSTISSDEVSYYKYNRSSIQTVRNTTITGGYVYNDKGTLNIIGGTILSPSNINNNIINKATMNFDGTIINDSCDLYDSRYYEDYTSIQNMSELSMKDVTFTMVSSNNGVYTMIKNTGTFNSNNSNFDVNRTINYKYCYNGNCSHYEVYGIDNTNTVNMEDGLIKIYDTSDASIPYTYYYGIKNTGSAISDLDGTGIDISGGLLSYGLYHDSSSTNNILKSIDFRISDVLTGYGVYVNTGIITTQTGNVQVGILTEVDENGIVSYTDKNVDTAYGVYVNSLNSEFILGVKDESAAGATEDADVSIVNPIIAAKGTESGIGIKKYDGKFRFYDGILIGNNFAKPETPTETNHIDYRAMTYYDDINGLEYSIQEYSRGNSNKRNMSASMNNVYYRTINAAVDRSSNNDTIVVQKSMEESILIPNNKTVTVDLNNHILSGSITNNGKMTLINGEVTTTGTEYDKAIINNGTLYIGIDDGTIVDNYVIIIGNSVGLQNNGIACMYDGYIRGALPTEGNAIVSRYDYQIVNKVIDGYDTVVVEGQNISNITITDDTVYNFEYDEDNLEQIFTVDETGYYRLEVWGAQGGYSLCNGSACGSPGYGGYSKGIVQLIEGDSLYINIGSQGSIGRVRQDAPGGYNGGGSGSSDGEDDEASGGGGGATHIATVSGELSSLETQKDKVLIVAAGGGGASWNYQAGSAGGYQGGITNGTSQNVSNQVTGYAFGAGQNGSGKADSDGVAGGGSGWYGGYSNNVSGKSAGTGGSSYIGSGRLLSIGDEYKIMNGYNVEESIDSDINTQNTTSYSKLPESGKAKAGDGYVRITKLILEES